MKIQRNNRAGDENIPSLAATNKMMGLFFLRDLVTILSPSMKLSFFLAIRIMRLAIAKPALVVTKTIINLFHEMSNQIRNFCYMKKRSEEQPTFQSLGGIVQINYLSLTRLKRN